jgi:hypothetical protein
MLRIDRTLYQRLPLDPTTIPVRAVEPTDPAQLRARLMAAGLLRPPLPPGSPTPEHPRSSPCLPLDARTRRLAERMRQEQLLADPLERARAGREL